MMIAAPEFLIFMKCINMISREYSEFKLLDFHMVTSDYIYSVDLV